MSIKIEESWRKVLQDEFEKPYFQHLIAFVKGEYATTTVYPPGGQIFHAFEACPFDQTKVVILGQDPYHGRGQAHGLAFSVADGVRTPPSLQNVFKELQADLPETPPAPNGNLDRWAEQGVLLLNATLTVRAAEPGSHQKKGWEQFTDTVIQRVSEQKEHLVFILWGAYAQKKVELIDEKKHLVLKAAHPSPYAADRGFFGSRPFSKTNEYLRQHGLEPIKW
ncbi:uracil-DNA glycosylase 2 [Hymenobacter qilianensis]|uniref:Uracil-DNA glycosylase 2 n=2 Tax=Hymenobacter qilianensis TaxID=1385715 RepID=A0ACB5PKZ7_9BACT|nr:uracil-DNA glycosylase [Hymenobacter qilianensis]QNP50955.1 uracil-DNA glycosylase [Hymenobacter qilianensis]GGF49117.1 uracil-DNA glycosylase 2 [Hymenobacter qilianensis]